MPPLPDDELRSRLDAAGRAHRGLRYRGPRPRLEPARGSTHRRSWRPLTTPVGLVVAATVLLAIVAVVGLRQGEVTVFDDVAEVPGTVAGNVIEVPGTSSEGTATEVPGTATEVPGTATATEVPGTALPELPERLASPTAGLGALHRRLAQRPAARPTVRPSTLARPAERPLALTLRVPERPRVLGSTS